MGGQVVKYTIPGNQLSARGVPNRSLVIGGLAAIVVPVVGVVIGFILGVYASELQRVGNFYDTRVGSPDQRTPGGCGRGGSWSSPSFRTVPAASGRHRLSGTAPQRVAAL